MKYAIIAARRGGEVEVIDECEERGEADTLCGEYQIAFGPDWAIWVEARPC